MVKRLTSLIFFILLSPLFLLSGEFTATINSNHVNLGEGFTLTLILKDASAKAGPSIEFLKQTFIVNSQQQSSNTVIMNGKMTSSLIWKFVLIPKQEGEQVIPAVSIDSSQGVLTSDPIKLNVVKGNVSSNQTTGRIQLKAEASNPQPYKNEPFFYTIKLNSQQPLANIQLPKFSIEEAIVEMKEEPKVYEKVIDGVLQGAVDFKYLITPLKSGTLKIPSTIVHGSIPVKRNKSQYRSFFDTDFDADPFSFMQGYAQLEPFALSTEEVVVEVQPAVSGINPWIPAESLIIEEIWDEKQKIQVGEFFNRGFKISAEGVSSSQLPSLNDMQIQSHQVKIYADKPEFTDSVKENRVLSTRTENYTFIPQESGALNVPEISVTWWDVENKEKMTTTIPARTLNVLPQILNSKPQEERKYEEIPLSQEESQHKESQGKNTWLYGIIAGLGLLFLLAIMWGISLMNKIKRLQEAPNTSEKVQKEAILVKKPEATSKKEKLNDLNPT